MKLYNIQGYFFDVTIEEYNILLHPDCTGLITANITFSKDEIFKVVKNNKLNRKLYPKVLMVKSGYLVLDEEF